MSRYFLHLHECGTATLDEDGVDCRDMVEAHDRAVKAAREVMCSEVLHGRLCLACYIEVRDEADQIVDIVRFREAIAVTGIDHTP